MGLVNDLGGRVFSDEEGGESVERDSTCFDGDDGVEELGGGEIWRKRGERKSARGDADTKKWGENRRVRM